MHDIKINTLFLILNYLGVTGGRKERCWKCLSIYRKHANVLQYRESKFFL